MTEKTSRVLATFFLYALVALSSCFEKNTQVKDDRVLHVNQEYLKLKAEFREEFINHFPNRINTKQSSLFASYNSRENVNYFFLYEYNKSIRELDSIDKSLSKVLIDKYSSSDTCLLVIYEAFSSYMASQRLSNKECTYSKTPIPFFYNLDGDSENNLSTKLDETYNIYVLEADTSDIFHLNINKNDKNNHKWRNGYSKGVSMSKQAQIIIYWSIAW